MSSTPQETQLEQEQSPSPQEKHTQDTETEEVTTKDEEQRTEEGEQKDEPKDKAKTPAKVTTSSQATSASKRKVDAITRNTTEPDKKKARKTPTSSAKKAPTKTKEFSFARPTASSASRTAAAARDHAQAKTKPTPPPTLKPLHPKRTPAKMERPMPAPKTPATDKASRPHFSYTPYTGPLPPLTVESSFAPKNSQNLERPRNATPAKKMTRKLVATPGKENNGVNTEEGATTNAALSSKTSRTPVKSNKIGSSLSENRSAFQEKIKAQGLVAQQAARASPISTSAAIVEPTA